jgi:hypothetical protein
MSPKQQSLKRRGDVLQKLKEANMSGTSDTRRFWTVMRYIVRVMQAIRRIAAIWAIILVGAALTGYSEWSWSPILRVGAAWLLATVVIAFIFLVRLDTFKPAWRGNQE